MDSLEIIKKQDELGQKIAMLYNSLSALVQQGNVSTQELATETGNLRESFKITYAEFDKNDKELRPPSATLERNAYFKSGFDKKVRETADKFENLYQKIKGEIYEKNLISSQNLQTQRSVFQERKEIKEPSTKIEGERKVQNFGLKRQFQYILDDLESKLEDFKQKRLTIDVVKEKFEVTERVFFQYIGEFPDDELTEVFYALRDSYQEIPDVGKNFKSLPFTLPSIDIPQFDGKFTDWDTFKELFEQLILSQPISKTQKMCVLKSKLAGEAIKKISKLPSREENFDVAWNILNEFYSNNRATTSIYFKAILDAPFVRCNSRSVTNFLDIVNESLQALNAVKIDPQEMYKSLICFILQRKLDDQMKIQFEQHLGKTRDLPRVDQLVEFLQQMQYSLEASRQFTKWDEKDTRYRETNQYFYQYSKKEEDEKLVNESKALNLNSMKCLLGCTSRHILFKCPKFRNLSIKEKLEKVKNFKLCYKCLCPGHHTKICTSQFNCRICKGKHNTLIHEERTQQKTVLVNNDNEDSKDCVLLSTAIVQVKTGDNKWIDCRVLLDGGSQLNIITKEFKNKLKLPNIVKVNQKIEGLQMRKSSVHEQIGIHMKSKVDKYKTFLNAAVLDNIVSNVPSSKMLAGTFPNNIRLADPEYNIPKGIDLLLSNEFVFDLICDGKMQDPQTKTKLQNTKLGWVAYSMTTLDNNIPTQNVVTINTTEERVLEKFWELEEVPKINNLTTLEKQCEKSFDENIKRLADGKFQVALPFKDDIKKLGKSCFIAKRRFFALERRLKNNPELKVQYHSFMNEYIKMGHMELTKEVPSIGYYLPHHSVCRPESTSTKLRVVFDASCKTTSNISLNDILHTGPRIQENLFNILLRFRKHRYVFSADIEKMYRQIWISENDRKYQLIFWRFNEAEPIKTYALKTVTYGTAAAPYLAVKCLEKIANWKSNQFPEEAAIIKNDFYMDDLMTGGNCLEKVKELRRNLNVILREFGMPLRKWCTNKEAILEDVNKEHIVESLDIKSDTSNFTKTLGVMWNTKADELSLNCKWKKGEKVTKRFILGEISRLFDPLGLVGPVVISTKILLQELWKLKIDWNEQVPKEIEHKWKCISNNFQYLNQIAVPRHFVCVKPTHVELHGFCDASLTAYGAAIYIRSIDDNGRVHSYLVTSKSRVAPIKVITLPRLELCAAVLLSELMNVVIKSLKMEFTNIYYYSDSTIVLSWIKIDPARLQLFVSNRVSFIQSNTNANNWRHVKSEENPADLISRGVKAHELVKNKFWFNGPQFLFNKEPYYNTSFIINPEIPEIKKGVKIILAKKAECFVNAINHRNNFNCLQNIIAYVVKFVYLIKKDKSKTFLFFRKEALNIILKNIQQEHFPEELKGLQQGRILPKSSKLTTLYPFLDKDGLIRVGGRLKNSSLAYEAKHPIVLPYKDIIVSLLIEQLHRDHLHVGPQGLLAITRQRFWPLRGKQLVKQIVNRCYRCFKNEPRQLHQLMGNLPKSRVIITRPFLNVGIDFLGPITIHYKIRGKRTDKSYVCVFVCFTTKAVHLEVVSDLTSAAFIGALKRFVARRGTPQKVFSDNATNFVGAANSLKEIHKLFTESKQNEIIKNFCENKGIEWLNIPARSPHIGGLWEATVRSVKKHFYRAIEGVLTYEELYTIMTQIEAILNSRPLTPLSDDPNDLHVLTPGHFLIGEPLTTFNDSSDNQCYHKMREHWKSVQSNMEKFWSRWSSEYLSELQKRYKWQKPIENIKPGTLVLLKDNTPPMSWRRGRVIRTILGSDGLCRMVDVRTSNGETKRSIHNVCPFPAEKEEDYVASSIKVPSKEKSIRSTHLSNNNISYKNISNNEYKLKNKSMLITLLSLLAILNPVKAQIDVNSFSNKSGIFFEKVETVGLSTSSWNLLVHVNISDYIATKISLDEAMRTIDNLRKGNEMFISSAGQNLQTLYERILNRHELIMSSAPRRRIRSLLPFIGSIQHALFGLMDEEHAEEISQKLKQNSEENLQMLNIVQNISSVQDITMDVIKKENKVVFKNIVKLSDSIKLVESEIHEVKDEADRIRAITNILTSVKLFEQIQEDIIEILLNLKGNFIHRVLPVKKFKQQIKIIKTSINHRLQLPSENPLELARVAQVSTRTTNDFILFNIRLPIINKEILQAYEIHTYPVLHDGLSIRIHTTDRYILINENRKSYYKLNYDEFGHCQKMSRIMLCHQIHPMFNIKGATNCEIELFLKAKEIPSSCEIEMKRFQNYWHQMHASNSWIFSVKEDTPADVICHDKVLPVIIQGAGVLKLQADCHLESDEVNLWAYDLYYSETNYVFPKINISKSLPSIAHIDIGNKIEIYKIPDIPTATTLFGFTTKLGFHHLAHYGISITTIIIIVIIIIAVIYLLRRLCRISSNYLPATVVLPRLI